MKSYKIVNYIVSFLFCISFLFLHSLVVYTILLDRNWIDLLGEPQLSIVICSFYCPFNGCLWRDQTHSEIVFLVYIIVYVQIRLILPLSAFSTLTLFLKVVSYCFSLYSKHSYGYYCSKRCLKHFDLYCFSS